MTSFFFWRSEEQNLNQVRHPEDSVNTSATVRLSAQVWTLIWTHTVDVEEPLMVVHVKRFRRSNKGVVPRLISTATWRPVDMTDAVQRPPH